MRTTKSLSVLVLMIALILPAWAESDPAVLTPVMGFFNDYNKHDINGAAMLFAKEPTVTDAFPPFHWEGKDAFRNWMTDLDNFNATNKYTDYDFKPGKQLSQDVEGERANVVVPCVSTKSCLFSCRCRGSLARSTLTANAVSITAPVLRSPSTVCCS